MYVSFAMIFVDFSAQRASFDSVLLGSFVTKSKVESIHVMGLGRSFGLDDRFLFVLDSFKNFLKWKLILFVC